MSGTGSTHGEPASLHHRVPSLAPTRSTSPVPALFFSIAITGLLSPEVLAVAVAVVALWGIWTFRRRESRRYLAPDWSRLYSRLGRDEVLDHDARDRMYRIIQDEPGIHVSELMRRVDGGWGGLMHHLHVLEDKEYVTSRDDGRYRRLFPVGQYNPDRMDTIALLRNESTAEALDIIARRPGINQSELASRMGMKPPSARYHLQKLQEAGLVRKEKDGRSVRFYAQRSS